MYICSRSAAVLGLAAALSITAFACRSTAPVEPGTLDARAPEPAKKPFVPPTWDAKSYESSEYGFSFHYPADFVEQPGQAGTLLAVASPSQVPRVDVSHSPTVPGATAEAIAAQVERLLATIGGGEAKVTRINEVKLRDEVTPAVELVADWSFQGFPLQSLVLVVAHGADTINVMATGMQGGELDQLSDIAYTLYFDP